MDGPSEATPGGAAAAPEIQRPIFVVGTVRSGTTLLSRWLAQHPEVAWVYGEHAGYELAAEWCHFGGISMGVPGLATTDCPPLTTEAATAAVRTRLRAGFASLLAARAPGRDARFLNKNPHLWNKLPFLRAVFPDARLIVTTRDIRSTVLSTQVLWMRLGRAWRIRHHLPPEPDRCWRCLPADAVARGAERSFPGGDVAVLGEYWLRVHETLAAEAGRFESAVVVRHRDLLADPDGTLQRIMEVIGLPPRHLPPPVALDHERNERWRHLLTSGERRRLEGFVEAHRARITALAMADTMP